MPLAVLAGHPALVSVKGVVFDVSDDEAYNHKGALAGCAGHDASRVIGASAGGTRGYGDGSGGLDAGLEGLRYEEHQRLEAYFVELARSRRAVAVLTDEDLIRLVTQVTAVVRSCLVPNYAASKDADMLKMCCCSVLFSMC